MIRKLEVLTNLAVLITSVVLCSVLVKKYFFSTSKQEARTETVAAKLPDPNIQQRQSIPAGTRISLPGIDWNKSNRTVVLALSTTCHFCSESAPFYQKLEQQRTSNVRLVAVLPQPIDDGRNYLNKLGVSVDQIVQAPLSSLGVRGTPTLILLDHNGAVIDSWIGKLADTEDAKVISRVREDIAQ